jgi:uncharacterized protein with HEPN domain
MLRAIDRIARYTANLDQPMFLQNEMVQDAVIRNIEILGEASNNILRADPAFAAQQQNIPWQVMHTMRNRVTHGYDQVDLEIIWKTVQNDLPRLRTRILEASDSISKIQNQNQGPQTRIS